MSLTPRKKTLNLLLLILCLAGLVLLISAYAFISTGANLGTLLPALSGVQAAAAIAPSTTSTPFQPLPTSTPTATHTPTSTPTPTNTPTPTPLATNTPPPTFTFTPRPTSKPVDGIPAEAFIDNVTGYDQQHTLSCEARSAVDWARHYGVSIKEAEFQAALPLSDNPEKGFVGDTDGLTGMIPPSSYGVHAPPVAAVLRDFGLDAVDRQGMSFDDLRRHVAAGDPVIVWVIGNVWEGGSPVQYAAPDGETVTVAHYEHTAIVIGYDEDGLTFVDGAMNYWRATDTFLSSWEVLGNMAIVID